jgi:cytochrome oxidase Cu insertion factor (SCO1/SenC/PrrC family)
MQIRPLLIGLLGAACLTAPARAQKEQKEAEFLSGKPAVGDPLPDVAVYTPDGKPFSTASLRGHYTVLTFGCLT